MTASPSDVADAHAAALPRIRLWMARCLLDCNGMSQFIGERRFDDAGVAELLCLNAALAAASRSLGDEDAGSRAAYSPDWAERTLRRLARIFERAASRCPTDDALHANLAAIQQRLELTDTEREVLHLLTLQQATPAFGDCLGLIGYLNQNSLCQLLATCLRRPLAEVIAALAPQGKLCRSAILEVDPSPERFTSKIEMLPGLADAMLLPQADVLQLFRNCVTPGGPASMQLEDYPHLAADLRILRCYLTESLEQRRSGVNVLIYGPPGTGKTELARALTRAAEGQLLEIAVDSANGEPLAGKHRFDAYRCAQSLLAASSHVLLFDEVEDVFNEVRDSRRARGNASGIKGWVNRWLETNAMPTFWITNDLDAIDPAYRRRFDYVLHVEVPPASVRRRMVDRYVDDLALSPAWRSQIADHNELSPAVLARAARMTSVVCSADPSQAADMVISQALNRTLKALETTPLTSPGSTSSSLPYRLELINADCDLPALQAGLGEVGQGRLCLFGPPGTGKTAFGRHLARALDRPLLVRRASDILSPYVGVAEKNIAQMFKQAQQDGAVLMIDEADSLLRDRKGAQRSWEVTQVNEMLTQMEGFDGIFIASTNLMHSLDEASLRRFDALVKLGYLKAGQAWELFASLCAELGLGVAPVLREELGRLDRLTPGDFASVQRLCRLQRPSDVATLLTRLRQLCDAKHDAPRRPIGFRAA